MSAVAPKGELHAGLAELAQAVADAKTRARTATAEHRAAHADIERLSEARVNAFAAGDEKTAAKLHKERSQAEAMVRDLAERVAGVERAVTLAENERGGFAARNLDGLLRELHPGAVATAAAVKDAMTAFVEAERAWEAFAGDVRRLLQLAAADTGTLAMFPGELSNLARNTRRAGGTDVPLPLPRAQPFGGPVPEDDPDPEIREAAREKVVREAEVEAATNARRAA